jgi:hypothetical protein
VNDGTFKFQNEEGVTLMKTILQESPDLGVTAATCNKNGVAGHDDDLGRKLTRIVALPDAEIMRADLAKNPQDWGRDFSAISRAGLSMIMLGLKEKLRRKQEQKAENEKKAESEFNKTLAAASDALGSHGTGTEEGGDVVVEKKKVSPPPPPPSSPPPPPPPPPPLPHHSTDFVRSGKSTGQSLPCSVRM